jgi:alkylation response protein AidB-like acyl-CoA dehydrogenase
VVPATGRADRIRATSVRRGHRVLTGTAVAGPEAGAAAVLAVHADDGDAPAWFLLPRDRSGVGGGPIAGVAGELWRVTLHDVTAERVPSAGHGPLAAARIRQAAYLTGLAAAALDSGARYTAQRRQFGRALLDMDVVGTAMAAAHAHVQAARLSVRRAALLADTGAPDVTAATRSLALAAETALQVTRQVLHHHGAHGMTLAAPIQWYYRHAAVEAHRHGPIDQLWLQALTTPGSATPPADRDPGPPGGRPDRRPG